MALTNANTINTRIQLKYDTYENWMNSNLEILPGEMCVALVQIPDGNYNNTSLVEGTGYKPAILIKIGDGTKVTDSQSGEERYKTFAELDYVQTKAADVYGWAKAATAPTAVDLSIGANASQAQKTANGTTIWSWLNTLDGKTDTNTIYELEEGQDDNVGKIRLNYKPANSDAAMTKGTWITVGQQISVNTNNALVANNTPNEEGLFVPKTTITPAASATPDSGNTTVNVLTGLTNNSTNTFTANYVEMYTKTGIDNLINPGMEFKGAINAIDANSMTLTADMVGDSYKIAENGEVNLNQPLDTAKIGDLIIVTEDTINNTYKWVLIPAGDDAGTDTFRPIYVNQSLVLDYNNGTAPLNLQDNTGIKITSAPEITTFERYENGAWKDYFVQDVFIGIDDNIVALKENIGALGKYTPTGSNTETDHTVKSYVDTNIAAAVSNIDVKNLTQTDTYLVFNCGNATGWTS